MKDELEKLAGVLLVTGVLFLVMLLAALSCRRIAGPADKPQDSTNETESKQRSRVVTGLLYTIDKAELDGHDYYVLTRDHESRMYHSEGCQCNGKETQR